MDKRRIGSLFLFFWSLDLAFGDPSQFKYILELEESHKQQWIDTHNYYRRFVSNPEAANMRLMTWDDELAELSKKVVRTCSFTHTPTADLKTSVFGRAGENLYTGEEFRFSEMMTKTGVVKNWYDEVQHYDYDNGTCASKQICGHYTQVVWDRSYKVGCAIAKCVKVTNGHGSYLIACNYGPAGNEHLYDEAIKPYKSGESCSQCGEGDLCVDQLCNNTARDIPFTTSTAAPTTTMAVTTLADEITTHTTLADETTTHTTLTDKTTTHTTLADETTTHTTLADETTTHTTLADKTTTHTTLADKTTTHRTLADETTTHTTLADETTTQTTSLSETSCPAGVCVTTTEGGGAKSLRSCLGMVYLLIGLLTIVSL